MKGSSEKSILFLFLVLIMLAGTAPAERIPRFHLDIESGAARLRYCDVQIPKSTGTRISFAEELQNDYEFFVRGRLTYFLNKGNALSLLVAPLTLHSSGSVDREVILEGESFPPNIPLEAGFTFNSYRLSYEHFWFVGDNTRLGLGVTAKVRDAAISIEDSTHISEKTNIGFVPLIKFSVVWKFMRPFALIIDGDALGAPQGRAEDLSVALQGDINDKISLKAGYRLLEGGSDIEEVYSFTWIDYLFGGVVLQF